MSNMGDLCKELGQTAKLLGGEAIAAMEKLLPLVEALVFWVQTMIWSFIVLILAMVDIAIFAPEKASQLIPLLALVPVLLFFACVFLWEIPIGKIRVPIYLLLVVTFLPVVNIIGRPTRSLLRKLLWPVLAALLVELCVGAYCSWVPIGNNLPLFFLLIIIFLIIGVRALMRPPALRGQPSRGASGTTVLLTIAAAVITLFFFVNKDGIRFPGTDTASADSSVKKTEPQMKYQPNPCSDTATAMIDHSNDPRDLAHTRFTVKVPLGCESAPIVFPRWWPHNWQKRWVGNAEGSCLDIRYERGSVYGPDCWPYLPVSNFPTVTDIAHVEDVGVGGHEIEFYLPDPIVQ